MIVDLILERKQWREYNAHDFYYDVMEYGNIGHDIARAMDFGEERDVKNALCDYIVNNEYNLDICNYINAINWL